MKKLRTVLSMFTILLISSLLTTTLLAAPSKVEIKGKYGDWQMMVNGKPFYIKGLCFAHKIEEDTIDEYIKGVKELGANSVRTWGVGPDTKWLLNAAEKQGIYVDVGIWLEHADKVNYLRDEKYKKIALQQIKTKVLKYKDHPAVLMWNIGNEVELKMQSDAEKVAYAKFFEEICKLVHEIDPNHPVITTTAWTLAWPQFEEFTPSLDIYGTNIYGGVPAIQKEWEKKKYSKPYVITEFGTIGSWEVGKDDNGMLKEPDDNQKVTWYKDSWEKHIFPYKGSNLGAYVFAYGGTAEDFIGLWCNLFVGGKKRTTYWGVYEMFTGKKATNKPPRILTVVLEKAKGVKPQGEFSVEIFAKDPEGDKLGYNVKLCNQELWGDDLKIADIIKQDNNKFTIKAPSKTGLYKIYFYVWDDKGNINVANRSILCTADPEKQGEVRRPRMTISAGVTTTASTGEGGNSAEQATDTDPKTRWESEWSDPQWIKLDLGAETEINTVKLKWETAYGKSYKIEVSNDDKNWTEVYSTNNGNGGLDKISFPTQSARYVQMYGTKRGTQWGYSIYEIEVSNEDESEIVPSTKIVASSSQNADFEPEKAFDSDSSSRWSSAWTDDEWIYIDFGAPKEFDTVVLNWEAAYGEAYDIQISDDATNWKTIYSTENSAGGEDVIPVGKQKARCVKMNGKKRATQWGYSLFEFEVRDGNTALGKVDAGAGGGGINAVASSFQQGGVEADKCVDGDLDSRWSSAWNDDEWIYIDLGAPKEFNTVVLNWEAAYGTVYDIQVSDDAENWKTIYSVTDGIGGEDILTVGKQKARYVKMDGKKRGTQWGYSLFEFGIKTE